MGSKFGLRLMIIRYLNIQRVSKKHLHSHTVNSIVSISIVKRVGVTTWVFFKVGVKCRQVDYSAG